MGPFCVVAVGANDPHSKSRRECHKIGNVARCYPSKCFFHSAGRAGDHDPERRAGCVTRVPKGAESIRRTGDWSLSIRPSSARSFSDVRRMAPGLPILMATAPVEEIEADALLFAGIAEVVGRPLVSGEVAAVLARCLADRQS
jgi:hypothetical protein